MEHRDRIFENEVVLLDGGTFTGCTFRNCQIVFAGVQAGKLIANHFYDCQWSFDGPAKRTLAFLSSLYQDEGSRDLVEQIFEGIRRGK